LPVLVAGLGLMLAGQAAAQVFATLHNFSAAVDGVDPGLVSNGPGLGGLAISGGTLYGTALGGGSFGAGTLFKGNTDGTGFAVLRSFPFSSDPAAAVYGSQPSAGLIVSGSALYGTTTFGGTWGNGTVFKVNTDGTGFTVLHSFTAIFPGAGLVTNTDGQYPSGLVVSGDTLYGAANRAGCSGGGVVFKMKTDGTGFAALYNFVWSQGGGAGPTLVGPGELTIANDVLYGISDGGAYGSGAVFKLMTDGTGFTVLHTFAPNGNAFTNIDGMAAPIAVTNVDGAFVFGPQGSQLLVSGDTLYGTAFNGGLWGRGTVFRMNTDGTSFTILHSFSAYSGPGQGYALVGSSFYDGWTNSDGARPTGGLVLSADTLYGTTWTGGPLGWGTVFAIKADGTGFAVVYSPTAMSQDASGVWTNSGGVQPSAPLALSGNVLYGTMGSGGIYRSEDAYPGLADGTLFTLTLPSNPPQLTITSAGANVVLTWPASSAGFSLQSTTNLVASAVWATNSSAPVLVDGQNTVTNPISGAQQFFRLSQ
jgi:uncharacterized repeat protein (TIGR03803 family)